jgi:ABC-type nitrate/sulfonate/bicarbonate transport system substrate-binding protein
MRVSSRQPLIRGASRLVLAALLLTGLVFALSCGGNDGNGGESRLRVQLDWTPNTNHIGIYVALANGWYQEAGIDVQIQPYTDINPDTIVANGRADIGISFPANVVFSRAAGLELVSVAAVLQRNPTELAVLASSNITRPRDFDGRTYAGFGLPYEQPQIRTVIQMDGGRGNFDNATLSTAAYEALYEGRADFTEIFVTWEGIEARLRGIDLRTFRYDDYGVPDFPGVIMVAQQKTVKDKEVTLRKFLEVTRRGYEYAAREPDAATQVFIGALPSGTFPEPEMVRLSTRMLASYFVDGSGRWGEQDADDWKAYSHWLVDQGIVKDSRDGVIASESDLPGGPLYTNALLPGGG